MFPLLVADIGGTNARFATVVGHVHGRFEIENQLDFPCAEFSSFDQVLDCYFKSLGTIDLRHASIAIAGPINGDFAKMTNLDWQFSSQKVRQKFGFDSVIFVNDLAAHALATAYLDASQFESLKPGTAQAKASRAIIGPGTGLGVASLHWSHGGWRAYPTEGGHIAFAPNNDLEQEIYRILLQQQGYVSLEMLLSGPGILNIYHSLSLIQGQSKNYVDSKNILDNAENDDLCSQTVAVLIGALGNAAGDLALVYGAKGGVYLGGRIIKHLLPFIHESDFIQRFVHKGFRSDYLASIPIEAVLYPHPGILGAALWYHQQSTLHEPVLD